MLIKVTQKHIDEGVACSSGKCPIANAIRDAFRACGKSVKHVVVGAMTTFYSGGSYIEVMLPSDAVNAFLDFDVGEPVQPFEFNLPIEEPAK